MASTFSIKVRNISKAYESQAALRNISFEVLPGELFGFIGPDGAGKTTLFRILTTLLLPDDGDAWMNGCHVVKDYRAIRQILGYMPGRFSLYQDLSVQENLKFFASIFSVDINENYDLIKDIYKQLEPFKNRLAGKLSGGMKQKLALCCALIHKPKILVLDEPTTGVDAVSRGTFWEMLSGLKKQGITIIVSTPYMDEAMRCDRVALIQEGGILKIDTPSKITAAFSRKIFAVKAKKLYSLLLDLKAYEQTYAVYPFGESLHLIPREDSLDEKTISNFLLSKRHENIDIEAISPDIEDCFIELMKNGTRE